MHPFLNYIVNALALGMTFLYGSTGEIITEKSGNLNLGTPGIMAGGAISGIVGAYFYTQSGLHHYYTHYGKSKEAKALKDDDLLEAIYILRVLLEFHICLVLGIDRRDAIARELSTHNQLKQLTEAQSKKCKM